MADLGDLNDLISDPDNEEFLRLFGSLDREKQRFFLHYMRASDKGYKAPPDLLDRFWIECFDQWKAGADPFVPLPLSSGEVAHG